MRAIWRLMSNAWWQGSLEFYAATSDLTELLKEGLRRKPERQHATQIDTLSGLHHILLVKCCDYLGGALDEIGPTQILMAIGNR